MKAPFETYKLILKHEYRDHHGNVIDIDAPIINGYTIDNTIPSNRPYCLNEILDRLYREMLRYIKTLEAREADERFNK